MAKDTIGIDVSKARQGISCLKYKTGRYKALDKAIAKIAKQRATLEERICRLMTLPGIGRLTATTMLIAKALYFELILGVRFVYSPLIWRA